jgi:hypothetical protein
MVRTGVGPQDPRGEPALHRLLAQREERDQPLRTFSERDVDPTVGQPETPEQREPRGQARVDSQGVGLGAVRSG